MLRVELAVRVVDRFISNLRMSSRGLHGELTLGLLSPHKWALVGGVGALVNSYG